MKVNTKQKSRQQGIVTIAVVVVLSVMTGLCLQLARKSALLHKSVRQQEYRLQCESLAAAGISRARKKLAKDPQYQGETWKIAATEIHQTNQAEVRIVVTGDEIFCEARYPSNDRLPCTMTDSQKVVP